METPVHQKPRVTLPASEAIGKLVVYVESEDGTVHGHYPLSQLKTDLGLTGATPPTPTAALEWASGDTLQWPDGSPIEI